MSQADVLRVSTHSRCPTCSGSGLNPQILESKINGFNILNYGQLEMTEIFEELKKIDDPLGKSIANQAIAQIKQLIEMGLGYLSLSRKMGTLSGGEAQRVKIARHLASSLNNMTYIFDEPSAGLHPEEASMLMEMLKNIKLQHNAVIVIEHDLAIIKAADEIIEMGSGAGTKGGEIVYQGKPQALKNVAAATDLNHHLQVNNNNLKDINIRIPKHLGCSLWCVRLR